MSSKLCDVLPTLGMRVEYKGVFGIVRQLNLPTAMDKTNLSVTDEDTMLTVAYNNGSFAYGAPKHFTNVNVVKYETHGLDTQDEVFFYEQDFYVLSNFSSFNLKWKNQIFYTSEVAYHWEKFAGKPEIQAEIKNAASSHDAFKIARQYDSQKRIDWNYFKIPIMREILWEKLAQHPYVLKKLMETGDRELIENSYRDDFWGWGPDKTGGNNLGKLWMDIRRQIETISNFDKAYHAYKESLQ